MIVPFASLRLQLLIETDRTLLAGTAQGKLNGHDRNSQDQQEKQVDQHKCTAAVLSHHVREFPDIPDPNGAAGTEQNKAQTAA